jgi:hypothetical protein
MRGNHEPDLEFVCGLERQLTSELRRRQRFGPIERSAGLRRFMRTSILLVVCAASGVAAAKTVGHLESSRRKALHLARAEASIEQLQARRRVAQGIIEEVKERVEAGIIHSDELAEAVFQSAQLDYELEKAKLDLEEVNLTSEAPSNELFAPLHGGRDFVSERLQMTYLQINSRKEHIEARLAGITKLVEAGLVQEAETISIQAGLERLAEELEDIEFQLDLRKDFLSDELTAREVALRQMIQKARSRFETTERIYKAAAAQLGEISKAHDDGLVPALEVKQAEHQMISARAEYRLAKIELELLEEEAKE